MLKHAVGPLLLAVTFALLYQTYAQYRMVDFDVYVRAADRASRAENLYRTDDGHYQFKYLPAFAIATRPFAVLPEPVARVVWYAGTCVFLAMLLRWSVRALPERNRNEPVLIALTAIVVAKFYWRELVLGQTNALLGVVLLMALLAAQIDARKTAAALVGVGVFVKPYALLLLPWVLLSGGLPSVGVLVTVVTVGLIAPAAIYGWQGNLDQLVAWYRTVSDTTNLPNLLNPENVSAMSAWTKWTGEGPHVAWLTLLTLALAMSLVAVVFSRRKDVAGDPLYLEFGLLTLLIPVISPQGWDYLLLLATPAMVCIIDRWADTSRTWQIAAGVGIALVSFTLYDPVSRTLTGSGVLTLGALTLAGCLKTLRIRKLA